jgi:hypothetical protein
MIHLRNEETKVMDVEEERGVSVNTMPREDSVQTIL